MQKRLLRRQSIRFFVGDLTNRRFMNSLGSDFDFVSCHGVISYVPRPDRAVRNLTRCLHSDGVLYLGVNGAAHFSRAWRRALPILGFDMRQLPSTRGLRRVLRLCDAVARFKIAQMPANYLGSDLFGPLIHNLPISKWIDICSDSGLHFAGDFSGYRNLRSVLNEGLLDILFARSRAQVHQLQQDFHRRNSRRPAAFSAKCSSVSLSRSTPSSSTNPLRRASVVSGAYTSTGCWGAIKAGAAAPSALNEQSG